MTDRAIAISISIIIEWKNQNLAADERAEAMLEAVRTQWLALRSKGSRP